MECFIWYVWFFNWHLTSINIFIPSLKKKIFEKFTGTAKYSILTVHKNIFILLLCVIFYIKCTEFSEKHCSVVELNNKCRQRTVKFPGNLQFIIQLLTVV